MSREVDYDNPTKDDAQYLRDRPWLPQLEDDAEFAEEDEFASMKVADLKAYAKDNNIDLGDATKRDEILEVLRSTTG